MDYSLPEASVHEILQARILERVAIPFYRGSSWPRDRTLVSWIAGRFFFFFLLPEPPGKPIIFIEQLWIQWPFQNQRWSHQFLHRLLSSSGIKTSALQTCWKALTLVSLFKIYVLLSGMLTIQSFSPVRLFATPWTAARQASLSITNSRSPPKPMSIESVMPSNHLILCRPLLLLPSIFPSIRVFSNESSLHIRWPKYWSFSFNINPTNEHQELIPGKKTF